MIGASASSCRTQRTICRVELGQPPVSLWSLRLWLCSVPAGDIRNDLYLTLEKGDFERGGKSVQKNIEVTMYVLYADGEILKVSAAFPESLRCSLQGHILLFQSL